MTLVSDDYDFFGAAGTYTPFGGAPVSVTVMVNEDFDREKTPDGILHTAEISIQQAEVAARPGYRDTISVTDGAGTTQTWTVVPDGVKELRAFADFAGEWVCKATRAERPQW